MWAAVGIVTLFKILKTTIKRNRSFTAKASQIGVVGAGANVKLTYTVSGRFLGKNAAGAATAEGEYRVDILNLDTNVKCTSNNQSWAATQVIAAASEAFRNAWRILGPAVATLQLPGYVSRSGWCSERVELLDLAGLNRLWWRRWGRQPRLQDPDGDDQAGPLVHRNGLSETSCSAGSTRRSPTSSPGYFQGNNSAGAPTAAGVYRLDVLFTDNNRKCTSNDAILGGDSDWLGIGPDEAVDIWQMKGLRRE